MTRLRNIVAMLASAFIVTLVFLERPAPAPSAATPAPTPVVSAPFCADVPHEYFAERPVDAKLAGPGSPYKRKKYDHGPSALPVGYKSMSDAELKAAIIAEYIYTNCADSLALANSRMVLDIYNQTDPNKVSIKDVQMDGLAKDYFDHVDVARSRIVVEKSLKGSWTEMSVPQANGPPVIKRVQRMTTEWSHILVIAVVQPDGSIFEDRRRVECRFQRQYNGDGEVSLVTYRP